MARFTTIKTGRASSTYCKGRSLTIEMEPLRTTVQGVGWPEDRNTTHWLENRGTVPAVEISVDIVRQE